MTIVVDINSAEQLEREFERIRTQFKDLKAKEKPLRIDWGLKRAFESKEVHKLAMEKFADKAKVAVRLMGLLEIFDVPEQEKERIREIFYQIVFPTQL
ncbi:MAG: hypothetical protein KKB59_18775 [Spirochaetes bacterium]|nr:hypothetical protein [Spirochaetota bacterium]